MNNNVSRSSASRILAVLVAFAIGVLTITVVNVTSSTVKGTHLNLQDNFPNFLFQILLVSIPFLVIAFLGITATTPWMIGIVLTVGLWGYYLYDSLSRLDANIGLAMLLMASPILISAACLLALRVKTRRPQI